VPLHFLFYLLFCNLLPTLILILNFSRSSLFHELRSDCFSGLRLAFACYPCCQKLLTATHHQIVRAKVGPGIYITLGLVGARGSATSADGIGIGKERCCCFFFSLVSPDICCISFTFICVFSWTVTQIPHIHFTALLRPPVPAGMGAGRQTRKGLSFIGRKMDTTLRFSPEIVLQICAVRDCF
jgi:hypothetical protein